MNDDGDEKNSRNQTTIIASFYQEIILYGFPADMIKVVGSHSARLSGSLPIDLVLENEINFNEPTDESANLYIIFIC